MGYEDLQGLRSAVLGDRVQTAAKSLPQSTTGSLFNIVGLCLVTSYLGKVTTIIQNQANNTKLIANPEVGTPVDLCDVLDIANDEVGSLYGITGTFSDALQGGSAGAVGNTAVGIFVNTGTIDLSCSASNTGAIQHTITYIPIENGAYISAA